MIPFLSSSPDLFQSQIDQLDLTFTFLSVPNYIPHSCAQDTSPQDYDSLKVVPAHYIETVYDR